MPTVKSSLAGRSPLRFDVYDTGDFQYVQAWSTAVCSPDEGERYVGQFFVKDLLEALGAGTPEPAKAEPTPRERTISALLKIVETDPDAYCRVQAANTLKEMI